MSFYFSLIYFVLSNRLQAFSLDSETDKEYKYIDVFIIFSFTFVTPLEHQEKTRVNLINGENYSHKRNNNVSLRYCKSFKVSFKVITQRT